MNDVVSSFTNCLLSEFNLDMTVDGRKGISDQSSISLVRSAGRKNPRYGPCARIEIV